MDECDGCVYHSKKTNALGHRMTIHDNIRMDGADFDLNNEANLKIMITKIEKDMKSIKRGTTNKLDLVPKIVLQKQRQAAQKLGKKFTLKDLNFEESKHNDSRIFKFYNLQDGCDYE